MRTAILLVWLLIAFPASGEDEVMNAEIDHLLATVAGSGCTFIRNGKEYEATDAHDHLAMKRRRGKRHFDSADEFIERIASSSSWSGKPYHIRCGDDEAVLAGEWFSQLLAEYRASSVS